MTVFTHIHEMVQHQAQTRPDALAVIDADGRRVAWATYHALILEAEALLQSQNAGAGERVLIVAENCLSVPVLMMAASRLGAWGVPVNARMSASEIARIIDHARPRVILFTSGVSQEAADHAEVQGAKPVETGFGTLHIYDTEIADPEPVDEADEVAVLLYTTGTTGDPKGVMLTHANLLFAARASVSLRGLTSADLVYGALPLTHVFGVASMLMASAMAGCAVQLAKRFTPSGLYEALRSGVTVLPAVPQMHALLMAYAADQKITKLGSDSLRYVSSGAAPLDPSWKRNAEAFYDLPLQNAYGMTETTAGVSGSRNLIGDADISVGPPLPGVEIKLDLSAGEDAEVGEVLTRGPHIMKGYFRNAVATRAAITEDGFLRTGDLGQIDAQGRLSIVGRAKELIIRGGFNVYPPEVEAALNDHPAVIQSAVIGHTAAGDEQVLAFVQVQSSVGVEDLRAFVTDRLAGYKRPSQIHIVDQLPAAATGKILKHLLAKQFADLIE